MSVDNQTAKQVVESVERVTTCYANGVVFS
jgi:hypothetical protein